MSSACKFLVITDEAVTYHETAEQAALAAGKPKWDCAQARNAISKLEPGDELDISPTSSVIRLTGKNEEFKA